MDTITLVLLVLISALAIGNLLVYFLRKEYGSADAPQTAAGDAMPAIIPSGGGEFSPLPGAVEGKTAVIDKKLELSNLRMHALEKDVRTLKLRLEKIDGITSATKAEAQNHAVGSKKLRKALKSLTKGKMHGIIYRARK